jgi:glycosyltransferase involved in cell wall biosynthesis
MKILFLGIITGNEDEGAKNVSINLSNNLKNTDDLLVFHQRDTFKIKNLFKIKLFDPDIILSIHGPSNKTILLLLFLKIYLKTKVSFIATQPQKSILIKFLISILNPEIIFVQSNKFYNYYNTVTENLYKICNGVNISKFYPQSKEIRKKFRNNYKIKENEKLLLHIGPINKNRNLELLIEVQLKTDWQVIVIGSTTAPYYENISNLLKKSGVLVYTEYFKNISEVYNASDAYIFPTIDELGSIEIPLTVLEAVACNCPVVSTPFRGLKDFLPESDLLKYFNSIDELFLILSKIEKPINFELNKALSWKNITLELRNRMNEIVN